MGTTNPSDDRHVHTIVLEVTIPEPDARRVAHQVADGARYRLTTPERDDVTVRIVQVG